MYTYINLKVEAIASFLAEEVNAIIVGYVEKNAIEGTPTEARPER